MPGGAADRAGKGRLPVPVPVPVAARVRARAGAFARMLACTRSLARAVAFALGLALLHAAAPAQPTPLVAEGGQLGPGWRVAALPRQKVPLTHYGVAEVDGRPAVRLEAAASYGNLVFDMPGQAAPARLRWSWRLERPNAAVDLAHKEGDDAAAKVCLAFELPLEQVPFVERQVLRMARSRAGEPLPAATLCWVWGRTEAREAVLPNPYSRRVRVIVLRNQADAAGRWFDEDRDVAADWRRTFGDESVQVPPLAAVIVAADADNTGAKSVAHVAGLRFGP
ncbi:MAG: DUF3047 domain-containing protein [Burkholderiales bacterium]|nr:DUF3047 domain-containing protein [Burkholderiales bacterium]